MVEAMIHNEKIYRRETEWIWNLLVESYEDQNHSVRNEVKRLTKIILEKYKHWKNDVIEFKSMTLDKIDKILKSISTISTNSWI